MSVTKMQAKRWEQLIEAGDPATQDYSGGPSPGGAAVELGCSRQMVHRLIKRGHLDVLAIYDGPRLSHYTISQASIARYKDHRKARLLADLKRVL